MSKKTIRAMNCYTSTKRLYFEFAAISSSDDSEFDFETFNSNTSTPKKK